MQPTNAANSIDWWRDVCVKGDLTVLPENAAPGIVYGSTTEITLTYEALYKKVVFYLALALGLFLVGAMLFWLARMCLAVPQITRDRTGLALRRGATDVASS